MKKYHDEITVWSKIVNNSFKLTNDKEIYSDEEMTKKYIHKLEKNSKKYTLPKKLGLKLETNFNIPVYSYNGNLQSLNKKILLYVHGGSYVEEAGIFQIQFAKKIAKKTNSILILPIYPLAPKGNYETMYESINEIYNFIVDTEYEINFLGDSAGGGFILSYSMYLRENKIRQPKNIIMMSPWLDISLTNPELNDSNKLDPMCGIEGNQYIGKIWSNKLDLKNYLVSPLYGEFNGLGNLTIITGGRDLLKPDCVKLDQLLDNQNIKHNYIEYKGQGHDFGAYPTKEAKLLVSDIANIVNGE